MGKIQAVKVVGQLGVNAARRPDAGNDVWIAIDISRTKLVYCVRWGGAEQRRLSTPMGLEHVRAVVEQYRDCGLHVAYEACGFGYEIAWWLQERGVATTVIAPSRMERAPGLSVKTDRLDAGKMARKLEKRELKGIYVPSRPIHEQRVFGRTYAQCVKERKRAQVRIRALMQEHAKLGPLPAQGWKAYSEWLGGQHLAPPLALSVNAHVQLRSVADQQARRMRAQLEGVAASAPYAEVVKALCGQSGVATLSAIRLVLELGDIDRFPTTGSLPHYLGLTPSEYSSGVDTNYRGHIMKCGPGTLRAILLQCAWAAVRRGIDQDLVRVFARLAPRIGRKRAIVAVARRLAIKLRQLWLKVVYPTPAADAPA
ncbi:MAG: IS110 family transposase [Burkholderiales bacterium]